MDRKALLAQLLAATESIDRVSSGEVSLSEFLSQYDNFYHRAALDGHEPGADFHRFLKENAKFVALHREVQAIIDLLFIPSGEEVVDYQSAGRIDADTALRRLSTVANEHGARSLIEELRA